ncbi:hypothetical protein [Actinomycetospora atypica]|uniref:Uncharacterized protein n=1 Tax=Actinomycetospora atypica TaxID=1290095 RepID=A0ABV9YIE4_9PSEU
MPTGPPPGRPGSELAVQLPRTFLDGRGLLRFAVGDEIEVAPALFVSEYLPTSGADGWTHDEIGIVRAQGSVLTSIGEDTTGIGPVSVLDADGRLFPLFWASTPPGEGHVAIGGALYLDPDLAPGTELGELVALCRERYRVTSIRVSSRLTWQPGPPVELSAVPEDVPPDTVLVAGLLPVGVVDTDRPPTSG